MLYKIVNGSLLSCPPFSLLASFPITVAAMGLVTLENSHSYMELVVKSGLSGNVRPGMRFSIWTWNLGDSPRQTQIDPKVSKCTINFKQDLRQ